MPFLTLVTTSDLNFVTEQIYVTYFHSKPASLLYLSEATY